MADSSAIITNGLWNADEDTDLSDFAGSSPPKKLMFSLNGRCNLRCDHCVRGLRDVPAVIAPTELVDHVIEHILPTVRAVRLGGTDLGEQLTSPDFDRFLRAVHEVGSIDLQIISNLTLMTRERAELIALTCDEFLFSIEGVGAAYERVRHFPWETVERNLDMLLDARARVPRSRLSIYPLVTCFHDNLQDLLEVLQLADQGVDCVCYRLFVPNVPAQASQSLACHRGEANRVFGRIRAEAARRGIVVTLPTLPMTPLSTTIEMSRGGGGPPEPTTETVARAAGSGTGHGSGTAAPDAESVSGSRRTPKLFAPPPPAERKGWVCHFPFEVISVLPDGFVGTCCEDIRLGHLALDRENVTEIWRGEEWQALRQAVAQGDWKGPCARCDFRRSQLGEL
jgi:pyruvate-formate lyase-activating enzyme